MGAYLYNILPACLIEEISAKMFFEDGLRLGDLLISYYRSDHPSLQNVLKAEEHCFIELPTPAFEVRIYDARVWRILKVVCHLSRKITNVKSVSY